MSKNSRTIRLSDKNRSVVLDVNPKNVTIAYPQKAERRELLGGEYIEMGKKGLRTATVETFLPGSSSPFKQGTMSAETAFQTIKKWKENGTAVGFSVSGVDSGTFYITSLMRTATEGDEDIGISLTLVERRRLSEKRSTGKEGVTGERNKAGNSIKKYTVKKGDCLWRIEKKFYGNGSLWRRIYAANRSKIKDPDLIYPGQVLVIPVVKKSEV